MCNTKLQGQEPILFAVIMYVFSIEHFFFFVDINLLLMSVVVVLVSCPGLGSSHMYKVKMQPCNVAMCRKGEEIRYFPNNFYSGFNRCRYLTKSSSCLSMIVQ